MPEDRKVFDIARPTATSTTRPVITAGPPAPDPMVKPPAKVSINVADEAVPSAAANIFAGSQSAGPAAQSAPVAAERTQVPVPPAEVTPEITNIAVSDPPPSPPDVDADPLPSAVPSAVTPGLPGAPTSDFANVPKFGELQPKIDAHPLFSGQKEHRVKIRRVPRFVWPLATLLILLIVAYLAIDAGVVRGYSHLPYHFFKPKTAVYTPPAITVQNTASTNNSNSPTSGASTNPYAGWKSYCDTTAKLCLKYPADWTESASIGGVDPINITSSDKTANILFGLFSAKPAVVSDQFYTYSISELSPANVNYKIIGGYLNNNYKPPSYSVVDSSTVTADKLTAGSLANINSNTYFSYSNDTKYAYASLEYDSSTNKQLTTEQATAWLASSDAKTGLKILQSLTVEQ